MPKPPPELPHIECPQCGRRSYHPKDIEHRYCSTCGFHDGLVGKTRRTRPNKCLSCGAINDAATPAFGNDAPSAGSISICFDCGHIMAFKSDRSLRNLTDDEMRLVAGDLRIIRLMNVIAEIRKERHAAAKERDTG